MQSVVFNQTSIFPGKIICIGRNYLAHIHELENQIPEEMVVFLKPNSAISTTLSAMHLDESLHYEAELAYLYQNGGFIAVALGLDLTKRGLQSTLKKKGLPWERAKAFDGSALFTPFISISNPDDELTLSLIIDDKKTQYASSELMMYKPSEILKELQSWMTLNDGDIVMTGTPKGVGEVKVNRLFNGQVFKDGKQVIDKCWYSQ